MKTVLFLTSPNFFRGAIFLLCMLPFNNVEGDLITCGTADIVQEVRDITCFHADLRTAVQRDDLLRKVSAVNVFDSLHSNDIVRSVKTLSLFNRALTDRISDTHEEYQKSGRNNYTVSITSYPAQVKKNSCQKHKTIDFEPSSAEQSLETAVKNNQDVHAIYADYGVITGKTARSFQTREQGGKLILCENTTLSYEKRLQIYCGQKPNNRCKKDLDEIPSCAEIDRKKTTAYSDQSLCVTLDNFSDLSKDLLMQNTALESRYCPSDCSYYTQTIQGVYKEGEKKYCSDNYLIVHCGPKKDKSDYNLNIREIKNICSDFSPTNRCWSI